MKYPIIVYKEDFSFFDQFLKSTYDLILIPHSDKGIMESVMMKMTYDFNLLQLVPPKAKAGDVQIVHVTGYEKYVAFACIEENGVSNYAVIRQVAMRTAQIMLDKGLSSLICPVLIRPGLQLDELGCFWIMLHAFEDVAGEKLKADFFIDNEDLSKRIRDSASSHAKSSAQLAFQYGMERVRNYTWINDIVSMTEYYHQRGKDKLTELMQYAPNDLNFYNELLAKFKASNEVFQYFFRQFATGSPEYRILILCGEVVAYIDRNAYNKKEWNKYPDRRTMALSGVNQTMWIENLLRFKATRNSASALTPSVLNALEALIAPAEHLTMLSENHRALVSTILWDTPYDRATFEKMTFERFTRLNYRAMKEDNNGILFSRILYSPEIEAIWLPDKKKFSSTRSAAKSLDPELQMTSPEKKDLVEESPEEPKTQLMQTLIHSDLYADTDLLNYKTYAEVITAFLTSELTRPPLTIGILAPWGKGKTSLMRFIESKLKTKAAAAETTSAKMVQEEPKTKYRELWNWLKKDTNAIFTVNPKDYPVVWFNAWKFQKNKQVWAGLAHEILTQLAGQLSEIEREKFWLRLNLKRIDKEKLKRDIVINFIRKLWLPLLFGIVGLIIGLLIKLFQSPLIAWLAPSWSSVSATAAFLWGLTKFNKLKEKPPEADISKYILQPEYKSKMGYYTAVEDDLRQALQLLSNPAKPPVIFIDDLDRCSPTTITGLVEAINLFISGDISSCYFIIGLDAQVISAALDVAYEQVGMKTTNMDKHYGSIGWYFMEKFIQLQFNLPAMGNSQSTRVLRHLLNYNDDENLPEAEERITLLAEYDQLAIQIATIDDLDLIFTERKDELEEQLQLFAPGKIELFQQKVISRAMADYDVLQSELANVIDEAAPYISASPRQVKRFANLFIFYRFMQYTGSCKGLREAGPSHLGNWLLIMVRWPQLVRAIQWDTEKGLMVGEDPASRAADFQEQIVGASDFDDWLVRCQERMKSVPTWQADRDLYRFFTTRADSDFLSGAVTNGLW